jgi:hypothetical protein
MDISEVIKILENYKKEYGDVPLYISSEIKEYKLFSLEERDFDFVSTDSFKGLIIRT